MSCFHPNLMTCLIDDDDTVRYIFRGGSSNIDSSKFGHISQFCGASADTRSPAQIREEFDIDMSEPIPHDLRNVRHSFDLVVPCRKCLGCRMDYAREWRNRMLFELADNPKAIFLTLTYRDCELHMHDFYATDSDYIIDSRPELHYPDVQAFFKRLRNRFPGRKLRYYICGEYGPRTFRPHYHAIIYGIDLNDISDRVVNRHNEMMQPLFTSDLISDCWKKGYILFSGVTSQTCAYVSRYVLKKCYSGDKVPSQLVGLTPAFNVSSRRPGIGFLNAEKYILSGNNSFSFSFPDRQMTLPLPSSFIKHCARNESVDLDILMKIRYDVGKASYERTMSRLAYLELPYSESLRLDELKLCDRLKILPERRN